LLEFKYGFKYPGITENDLDLSPTTLEAISKFVEEKIQVFVICSTLHRNVLILYPKFSGLSQNLEIFV